MPHRSLLVAIDIGGTKTALMVADAARHEPLAIEKFKTDVDATPEAFAADVKRRTDALLMRERLFGRRLRAVGAAVPGAVDSRGHVLDAGKLGWKDAPLRDLLAAAFSVPAFVEHDANSAALGERWKGHAAHVADFVFLSLGTGVGAGLFIGGRLHRGAHHAAGEIGNMLLRRRERSKRRGELNLDKQVGSVAIKERAGADPDTPAREVLADPDAAAVAERVADEIAAAVINICTVVDPELVVVGGGTTSEELLDRVRARVAGELKWKPKLVRSALGEEAQLYGALYGALGLAWPNARAA